MEHTRVFKLSGLEAIEITDRSNFVNIGERTNVTGSARFLKLIKDDKFDEALEVALDQVRGGAQIIDVSGAMKFLLRILPEWPYPLGPVRSQG
jgi:5-methyltetrahydrofolate--homocysteine methyltransferase